MTIYAVTAGEYSAYRIIALTVNKERAEYLAKIHKADIEEYEDVQEFPAMPMWLYWETHTRKKEQDMIMAAKYKVEREGIT